MQADNWVDKVADGLSWRQAGTGPVVVFLHGLGGTRAAWGPQLRGLAGQFRCIAWDMPGYGDSTAVEPLSYPTIATSLVRLLDLIETDTADLVGLSFGGMHALHTAIAHPQRVNRMVLANTSPAFGMDGTTAEDWIASRLEPIDAGGSPADVAEMVIDAITASPLGGQIRDETVAAFGDISPQGFRAAVNCLPHNDVRDQLAGITHESLVIVGELDDETPVSYAKVLADGMRNARLEILEGVGHLSPAEAPTRFNNLVSTFLSSTPQSD